MNAAKYILSKMVGEGHYLDDPVNSRHRDFLLWDVFSEGGDQTVGDGLASAALLT
jgi:hypothetical protein